MMTIKVYRVDADGQRIPAGATVTVPNSSRKQVPPTLAFPPCTCRRCQTASPEGSR